MAGTAYDNSSKARVASLGPDTFLVKSTFTSTHVWVQGDSIKMFNIPANHYILSWDVAYTSFGSEGGATTTIQIGDTANAVDHYMTSALAGSLHQYRSSRVDNILNPAFTVYSATDNFIITLNSLESTGLGVSAVIYAWALYTSNQG